MLDSTFKYKITIAYDGTAYCGWQVQPNGISIQQLLEKTLKIVLKKETPIVGAGRTDAGVHAYGQVAHLESEHPLDTFKLFASLNGLLPKEIRVLRIEPVPITFHARFSAFNKEYHYHLQLGRVQDPFFRLYRWHLTERINIDAMRESARLFLGTHDFSAFANESDRGAAGRNPIRTVKRLDLLHEGDLLRLEFEADSFLYKMVRNLTGILVEVGRGKRSGAEVEEILFSKDRKRAGQAAPAQGLFLMRVDYPATHPESENEAPQEL